MTVPSVLLALFVVLSACSAWFIGSARRRPRRGRTLVAAGSTRLHTACREQGGITWGGAVLPPGVETSHFLCVGTTGSGKSLNLDRLMYQALSPAKPGAGTRALIYDAKTELAATLRSLELKVPVYFLHPFDARGVSWDMAADITSPASALQVSSILIPEEQSSNRYFTDTARDILTEVMLTFAQSGARWSLRDLVLAMRSKERLEGVLQQTERGAELYQMHAGDPRAFQNVLSTARSRLAPFEPVAACWARAKGSVSLRDWVQGDMVLVLGNDDSARAAIDAVNRLIFQRATELVLGEPDSSSRRTWFFLDEVREAGKLDGLSRLMTKGRSRGACVALGFQSVNGMVSVYGREVAHEILGQCSQKAFLRVEDEESARWASATIGQYEELAVVRGKSTTGWGQGGSHSESEQWRRADVVLPSEFLSIPPTSLEWGLTGYFLTPHVGAWRRTLPLHSLLLPAARTSGKAGRLEERPESDQFIEAWSTADEARLGLEPRLRLEQGSERSQGVERENKRRRLLAPEGW